MKLRKLINIQKIVFNSNFKEFKNMIKFVKYLMQKNMSSPNIILNQNRLSCLILNIAKLFIANNQKIV